MGPAYCPSCGTILESGAKFCPSCGRPQGKVAMPAVPGTPSPTQGVSSPVVSSSPSAGTSARKPPWAALAVLTGGVITLVVVLLLVRDKNQSSNDTATAPTPAVIVGSGGSISGGVPTPVAQVNPTPTPHRVRPTPTPPIEYVYEGRMAAKWDVDPEDAIVTVNGRMLGKADDWDGVGAPVMAFTSDFTPNGSYQPGSYYAKLELRGYRTAWVKIIANPNASEDVARINFKMRENED